MPARPAQPAHCLASIVGIVRALWEWGDDGRGIAPYHLTNTRPRAIRDSFAPSLFRHPPRHCGFLRPPVVLGGDAVTHVVTSVDDRGRSTRTLKYLIGVAKGQWVVNLQCTSYAQLALYFHALSLFFPESPAVPQPGVFFSSPGAAGPVATLIFPCLPPADRSPRADALPQSRLPAERGGLRGEGRCKRPARPCQVAHAAGTVGMCSTGHRIDCHHRGSMR